MNMKDQAQPPPVKPQTYKLFVQNTQSFYLNAKQLFHRRPCILRMPIIITETLPVSFTALTKEPVRLNITCLSHVSTGVFAVL